MSWHILTISSTKTDEKSLVSLLFEFPEMLRRSNVAAKPKEKSAASANGVSWQQPVGCLRQFHRTRWTGQFPNYPRTRRRPVTVRILCWFTEHMCSNHIHKVSTKLRSYPLNSLFWLLPDRSLLSCAETMDRSYSVEYKLNMIITLLLLCLPWRV